MENSHLVFHRQQVNYNFVCHGTKGCNGPNNKSLRISWPADGLFEFVDYATASLIEDQIYEVIRNYEPRVNNVIVQVDPQPDTNEFTVTVTFDIIGQEIPTQQFSFILEAAR